MLSSLKRRLGFKDRLLFKCRGEHEWYRVYGDAILHSGSTWLCERCPATDKDRR